MGHLLHPTIKDIMKKLFLLCICPLALADSLFGQAPTETPVASPTTTAAVTATTSATSIAAPALTSTATPAPTATGSSTSSDLPDKIHHKLEKQRHGKHGITIDTGDKDEDADLEKMRDFIAIPSLAIVILPLYGASVLMPAP